MGKHLVIRNLRIAPDADGVGSTQPLADPLKQGIPNCIPFHEELLQMDAEEDILTPQSQVSHSLSWSCHVIEDYIM